MIPREKTIVNRRETEDDIGFRGMSRNVNTIYFILYSITLSVLILEKILLCL